MKNNMMKVKRIELQCSKICKLIKNFDIQEITPLHPATKSHYEFYGYLRTKYGLKIPSRKIFKPIKVSKKIAVTHFERFLPF